MDQRFYHDPGFAVGDSVRLKQKAKHGGSLLKTAWDAVLVVDSIGSDGVLFKAQVPGKRHPWTFSGIQWEKVVS